MESWHFDGDQVETGAQHMESRARKLRVLAEGINLNWIGKEVRGGGGVGGTWEAQLIGCPTSAQVVISWFVGSSPVPGSVLTAQSLEPPLYSVSSSLCPYPTHTLSLSPSKINKH